MRRAFARPRGARDIFCAIVEGLLEWGDLVTHPDEHKRPDLLLPEMRLNPNPITVLLPILVTARMYFENLYLTSFRHIPSCSREQR